MPCAALALRVHGHLRPVGPFVLVDVLQLLAERDVVHELAELVQGLALAFQALRALVGLAQVVVVGVHDVCQRLDGLGAHVVGEEPPVFLREDLGAPALVERVGLEHSKKIQELNYCLEEYVEYLKGQ